MYYYNLEYAHKRCELGWCTILMEYPYLLFEVEARYSIALDILFVHLTFPCFSYIHTFYHAI